MKLIKNADTLIENQIKRADILFDENGIKKIIPRLDKGNLNVKNPIADISIIGEIIDARGLLCIPGLIDVHVHLREPGFTQKETIKTGTMAAARGGFTTIMAMPNVNPFPDNAEAVKRYMRLIKKEAVIDVVPYACITTGEKGEEVTDIRAIKREGISAFSDDGVGVQNDEIMRYAMKRAKENDCIIAAHTEDMHYRKKDACINEGAKSKELGVLGIPNECEYKQLERDLRLVEEIKAKYHCCHISAMQSVKLLREYKAKGLDVSGEAAAHHLLLTEEDIKSVYDTNFKMNPPLRTEADRQALIEGLLDGTIDMIASDHAPHTQEEKAKKINEAPFGIVSLETSFAMLYTKLVMTGKMSLAKLVDLMSKRPAKRFFEDKRGELKEGYRADIVLIDIKNEFVIDKRKFLSKGKNTPFDGQKCFGRVVKTFANGKLVYDDAEN